MDVINFDFTKKKKRSTAPVSQSAVAKVVGGALKQGISREQGAYGVTQGNEGWRSQYTPQNELGIRRNAIIDTLTQSPSFKMPKIKHSLLTNEGFNEALGVVGARNRAKLDMQNRRVLSGVLGSLLSYDSQRHAADQRYRLGLMDNETRKRGQDLTAKAKADALKETAAYHQILGNYYKNQNEIGRERNLIAAQKAAAAGKPKELNPLDAALKRQKLAENSDAFLKGIYGEDIFGEMDDAQRKEAIQHFVATGKLPAYRFNPDTFNDTISRENGYIDPLRAQNRNATQRGGEITPDQVSTIHAEIAKDYGVPANAVKFDPKNRLYILPNGKALPLDAAYRTIYGGQ